MRSRRGSSGRRGAVAWLAALFPAALLAALVPTVSDAAAGAGTTRVAAFDTDPARAALARLLADHADGQTWLPVGQIEVGTAAASQDVGVFSTAANGWTGTAGLARFRGFEVTAR